MDNEAGTIEGCSLAYRCPKQWKDLSPIENEASVRWCTDCRQPVFFVRSKSDLKRLSAARSCIAFLASEPGPAPKASDGGDGTPRTLMGVPVGLYADDDLNF